MKKLLKLLTIIVIFATFSLSCSAKEEDKYIEDFSESLPGEYRDIATDPEKLTDAVGIKSVLYEIIASLSGEGGRIGAFALTLLGSIILMGIASFAPGELKSVSESGVSAICSLLIFSELLPIFRQITDSISQANTLFASLIPLMGAVTLAGGGVGTAAVQTAGMNITLSLIGSAGKALFTLVSGFALAMSIVSSFGGEGALSVSKSVKGIFNWLLGIATALIMGTLSLQTMISAASDSAAMRTAKYFASGLIPVVGGTVSGALSTLAAGLSYVKGVIGVGSIWVLLSVFLSPLALLLMYRLMLSLSVSLSEIIGAKLSERCFSSFRFSLDTLISVHSLSLIIYIFQIILFVKSGVSIL